MCIIAAKAAGVAMPDRQTIRNMWDHNPDGAGIMYVEKGMVRVEKGFMKYKSFAKKLDQLEKRLDMTKTPVVMHFRITTHGGTKPENCHPFPITDSIGALKKTQSTTDVGVAHNGIIPITPRKDISDTMEYIASQLAPLKRALPRFYENKNAMLLIKNAIDSKMAFLTKEGKIYTVGDFNEHDGILYSNYSYEDYKGYYRNLGKWSCYSGWGEDDWGMSPIDDVDDTAFLSLSWLDDGDYVTDSKGLIREGFEFLLGSDGTIYEYDFERDMAVETKGLTAYTAQGVHKRFDEELAEPIEVHLGSTILY